MFLVVFASLCHAVTSLIVHFSNRFGFQRCSPVLWFRNALLIYSQNAADTLQS